MGCQPLIPHRPGTHMNTWVPRERICMCTHTYTQAWHTPAHACAPYVQSFSDKPYEVTQLTYMPTWKWRRAEAGRMEQSWGEAASPNPGPRGGEQLSPRPHGES